jgi:hypothetical protein
MKRATELSIIATEGNHAQATGTLRATCYSRAGVQYHVCMEGQCSEIGDEDEGDEVKTQEWLPRVRAREAADKAEPKCVTRYGPKRRELEPPADASAVDSMAATTTLCTKGGIRHRSQKVGVSRRAGE